MCSFIEVAVYGIQRPTSLYKKNNNSREVIVFTHVKKHGSFTYIIVGNKEQQGKNKTKWKWKHNAAGRCFIILRECPDKVQEKSTAGLPRDHTGYTEFHFNYIHPWCLNFG